jgi:hypothetical protein
MLRIQEWTLELLEFHSKLYTNKGVRARRRDRQASLFKITKIIDKINLQNCSVADTEKTVNLASVLWSCKYFFRILIRETVILNYEYGSG